MASDTNAPCRAADAAPLGLTDALWLWPSCVSPEGTAVCYLDSRGGDEQSPPICRRSQGVIRPQAPEKQPQGHALGSSVSRVTDRIKVRASLAVNYGCCCRSQHLMFWRLPAVGRRTRQPCSAARSGRAERRCRPRLAAAGHRRLPARASGEPWSTATNGGCTPPAVIDAKVGGFSYTLLRPFHAHLRVQCTIATDCSSDHLREVRIMRNGLEPVQIMNPTTLLASYMSIGSAPATSAPAPLETDHAQHHWCVLRR